MLFVQRRPVGRPPVCPAAQASKPTAVRSSCRCSSVNCLSSLPKSALARCGLRRSRPCADARHRQTVNEWPVPTGHRARATGISRQAAKIRELGQSLIDAGFVTLDQQSEALGLARSTTWTILRASQKGSGLSAAVINRMLLSLELPPLARRKILEYTTAKLAGVYGGSRTQRRRFFARLSIKQARRATPELGGLSRVSL
jgi:hypothetical protein